MKQESKPCQLLMLIFYILLTQVRFKNGEINGPRTQPAYHFQRPVQSLILHPYRLWNRFQLTEKVNPSKPILGHGFKICPTIAKRISREKSILSLSSKPSKSKGSQFKSNPYGLKSKITKGSSAIMKITKSKSGSSPRNVTAMKCSDKTIRKPWKKCIRFANSSTINSRKWGQGMLTSTCPWKKSIAWKRKGQICSCRR